MSNYFDRCYSSDGHRDTVPRVLNATATARIVFNTPQCDQRLSTVPILLLEIEAKTNLAAEIGRASNKAWILMKQETSGWQRHQLNKMQIIHTSLQADNHASTSSLNIFTGRMLFLTPNQQRQCIECNIVSPITTKYEFSADTESLHT